MLSLYNQLTHTHTHTDNHTHTHTSTPNCVHTCAHVIILLSFFICLYLFISPEYQYHICEWLLKLITKADCLCVFVCELACA